MLKNIFKYMLKLKLPLLLIFAILLIFSPTTTLNGAKRGLNLWAILVPSLFPFIVLSNILFYSGVVKILSRFLDPIMRPLFNLSGACAFAVALGFSSGFPMGAITTNSLYKQNLCTKDEASRLVSFTNNSSPLYILGAVSVTMLNYPSIGIILLISHYLSNLLIGILLGIISRLKKQTPLHTTNLASQTLPLSQALSMSITNSISSILNIGGFVIFFSVIISLADTLNIFTVLTNLLSHILPLNPLALKGLLYGIIEMTLSCQSISQAPIDIFSKALLISFTLGFSGICVHAQVISILKDVPYKIYLLTRPLQAILSSLILYLLWGYQKNLSVFMPINILNINTLNQALFSLTLLSIIIIFSLIIYNLTIFLLQYFRQ